MKLSGLRPRRLEAWTAVSVQRPRCRSSSSVTRVSFRLSVTRRSRQRGSKLVVCTYPEPETEKERSPLDYPQEWVTPQPSRRPDIFPEFEKLETPLPKPLPGDPEQPDEEEEIEKDKEKPKPEPDEDPEKDPEKDPEEPELPDSQT